MITQIAARSWPTALGVLALAASAAAQGAPNQPASNPACVRLESQLAAINSRLDRSDPRRPGQARRRRRRQAAGRPRPHAGASAQAGLRGPRLPVAVLGSGAAMRADQLADPADARQPRPRHHRSRAAQERHRQPGQPAPRADRAIGAEQLRRAIYRRRQRGRTSGFFDKLFGGGGGLGRRHHSQSRRRRLAGRHLSARSACAPATATISRSRTRRCRAASPTTSARASACAPRPKSRSTATAIRARTWSRRCRSSGQPYTALPNAFHYRKEFTAACSCRKPGQSWGDALKDADDSTTLQGGDIVVTDQTAKTLSQAPQPKPVKGAPAAAAAQPAAGTTTPATTPAPTPASAQPASDTDARPSGPPFAHGADRRFVSRLRMTIRNPPRPLSLLPRS